MPDIGQELSGPGIRLPPPHLHPNQEERFEVLGARSRPSSTAWSDGTRPVRCPSSPPASCTSWSATAARVNWQVRPALRAAEFFEALYAGIEAAQRGEHFDVAAFLGGHAEEIRFT
ncbi:MAG: hypothetical protein ACR2FE_05125 [Aeromicrobium sp.]